MHVRRRQFSLPCRLHSLRLTHLLMQPWRLKKFLFSQLQKLTFCEALVGTSTCSTTTLKWSFYTNIRLRCCWLKFLLRCIYDYGILTLRSTAFAHKHAFFEGMTPFCERQRGEIYRRTECYWKAFEEIRVANKKYLVCPLNRY